MRDGLRTIHHQADGFYLSAGSHYVELSKEEIRSDAYRFLDGAYRATGDGKLAPFNPNRTKVANVLEALAAETQLPFTIGAPAWLDDRAHPPASEILSCRNGLLHLATRSMHLHSPAFFTLNAVDYDYDPNAREPIQ